MNAAPGIAAAQARISEIQARLQSMQTMGGRVGGVVGNAAAAHDFQAMVAEAAATPAAAAPVQTHDGHDHGMHAAGATRGAAVAATGSWAARLPAAGQQWAGAIEQAATRHGVEPELLASLVWAESGFHADAVSHAGARGLAQLMPGTAAGLGVNPDDPIQNLEGGARYLREQLDRFGSTELALAAYNAGPGRVAQAGGIPRIAETQAYVPKVMGYYAGLKGTA